MRAAIPEPTRVCPACAESILGIALGAAGLIYAGAALAVGARRDRAKGRIPAWIGGIASLVGPGIGIWAYGQLVHPS